MQWQKNITLLAVLRKYLHRIQSVISRKQVQELVLLFVNKLCCVLFVVVDDKKRKTTLGVKASGVMVEYRVLFVRYKSGNMFAEKSFPAELSSKNVSVVKLNFGEFHLFLFQFE